jgi:hypothetical protein
MRTSTVAERLMLKIDMAMAAVAQSEVRLTAALVQELSKMLATVREALWVSSTNQRRKNSRVNNPKLSHFSPLRWLLSSLRR